MWSLHCQVWAPLISLLQVHAIQGQFTLYRPLKNFPDQRMEKCALIFNPMDLFENRSHEGNIYLRFICTKLGLSLQHLILCWCVIYKCLLNSIIPLVLNLERFRNKMNSKHTSLCSLSFSSKPKNVIQSLVRASPALVALTIHTQLVSRQYHALSCPSCLCGNACKRSPAKFHMGRALGSGSRLLPVTIYSTSAEQAP